MEIEKIIKDSRWWRDAQTMADKHYSPESGISLANHLEAVTSNLRSLLDQNSQNDYALNVQMAILDSDLDPGKLIEILEPVALLHDIGKTAEDKETEISHPITGELVKKRHPVMSLIAAIELLPDNLVNRNTILALAEEHDTPYSWYNQAKKTGQVPKRKSWARLDRKIDAAENGSGILLLSLFKIVDIDGHENINDVIWFIDQANVNYLIEKGKGLPVPKPIDLERLSNAS